MSMVEIWLPIPETGDLYEASSLGQIRSKDRVTMVTSRWGGLRPSPSKGRTLHPWKDGGGYLVVRVCFDDKQIAVNAHRLVAAAFHGDADGRHVNHIDGDKQNNRADNLEWVTRAENMAHARATGLVSDERPIIAEPNQGGEAIRFRSVNEATRAMGASRTANIVSSAKGRIPSAYGYRWKYEDELEAA